DAKRQRMAGDASTRSYARLLRGENSFILMNSPRRPDGPAIYRGNSYSAAVHLAEDVRPVVPIADPRTLSGCRRHAGGTASPEPARDLAADTSCQLPDSGFRHRCHAG